MHSLTILNIFVNLPSITEQLLVLNFLWFALSFQVSVVYMCECALCVCVWEREGEGVKERVFEIDFFMFAIDWPGARLTGRQMCIVYMCVCVRERERERECVCVYVRVCMCVWAEVSKRVKT